MLLGSMILKDCGKHVEEMEEEFQYMYFASEIIDGTFEFFKIEHVKSCPGKPPHDLRSMIKLIFYD